MTRILLAVGLSLLSAIACAREAATPYEPTEKEILQFASEQMITTIAALGQRVGECEKAAKRVLDPALMKSLPLSNSEWGIALSALGLRAGHKCEEDGHFLTKALVAVMKFQAAEKHYKGKNAIKIPDGAAAEFLCCAIWRLEITQELKYQRLDPQARKVLESIPELNEPFNFLATVKAWGIMKKSEQEQ